MKAKKLPNKKLLIILGAIAFFLLPLILFLLLRSEGSDRWYDSSWSYRKAVYLEAPSKYRNSVGEILFDVDTKSLIEDKKLSPDCKDILLVDETNRGALPYRIEGGCNSEKSQIRVRVVLSRKSRKTVYMYYGNEEAKGGETSWEDDMSIFEDISIALGGEEVADVLGTTGSGPSKSTGLQTEGQTNPVNLNTPNPGFSSEFNHPDYP